MGRKSSSPQEGIGCLFKAGLSAKPSKCVWGATSLEFLVHKIGNGVVNAREVRVKALRDYIRPTYQKGIRAFLGTINYYRRFIPDCARWAAPLNNALKKGAPCVVEWNKKQCVSFQHLVSFLCNEHTLTLLKVGDKHTLHTDASGSGIGAVLSVIREGEERPMANFSRRLTAAQCNYSASELECFAVVKAIDHFALHLLGQRFTVITDHSALFTLLNSSRLNGRLMRWALALLAFDMDIK